MTNIYFNSGLDMLTVTEPIGQIHGALRFGSFFNVTEEGTGTRIVVNPALVAYLKEVRR